MEREMLGLGNKLESKVGTRAMRRQAPAYLNKISGGADVEMSGL